MYIFIKLNQININKDPEIIKKTPETESSTTKTLKMAILYLFIYFQMPDLNFQIK